MSSGSAHEPPFRKALVGVDAGPRGERTLQEASRLLRSLAGELILAHVVLRPTSSAGNDSDGAPANAEETTLLEGLHAAATRAQLVPPFSIRVLHGDPAQRLCEYAGFLGCDLIVLGPRGPGGLARALRGSVGKDVVGKSPVATLVLAPGAAAPAPPPSPTADAPP